MSVFRPAARVTAPDGQEWEIYAYKVKLHELRDPDELGPPLGLTRSAAAEWSVVDALYYALMLIPRALFHVGDYALAGIRSLRSDEWTIDAITYLPAPTVSTWTTTSEYKGQVLAQVEGNLARGHIPTNLGNAVYRGERRSAR